MTPVDRVRAVLQGRRPDRPPVGFWHHFGPDEIHGPGAVRAHLRHLEAYDLDFLKVMNDNGYPHATTVQDVADLASIVELKGDEPAFARQLDLLRDLKQAVRGRVLMVTTLFNAWTVLRHLIRPPRVHTPPDLNGAADEPSGRIKVMLAQDPAAVRTALHTIARNQGRFARRCLQAGADGIYLSVRDDWVDQGDPSRRLYAQLVEPTDLAILREAAEARFNVLHVCGKAVDFQALARYPVHALSWADRAAGPAIAQACTFVTPAICAGVDNLTTLPQGTPEQVAEQVRDALGQAGDRPIIVAPGCTYDPQRVPAANLLALCQAARAVQYGG